ncbi:CIH_HP2_G0036520.mRNA.1.CDS.1 [Saccharomyces cerevisiae]|nr:CFF_HP2_G0033460.mRNA.1.CDS.1 [Saccharomyces cerevisiae]CAI5302101.1 CIH_HP2_G0036520.mRNA.1.CDS.1 [Saccharomyces cerevisiae]CAI6619132.1 CFF_HP2_G0033460.mRNA.1.CDS.1 [Saccharomyces cerevisiae]CAI6621210.1 CFF_HP1_G0035210.mRNA.1.CDS.1 [Saccharomyces cerevisiae]CAI6647697.1 CIH_HP1_G0037450.mRNA.1.CDS.1 [Saccharomyces cerevisiae]
MSEEDDHWNLVRLRRLRKGREGEEQSSKSEISLDSLHESSFAGEDDEDFDADVLSNTSSEESAQMNRIYDFRTSNEFSNVGVNIDRTGVPTISESFDTLSGSNIGGTVLPSMEGSKLKDSTIRNSSSRSDHIIDKSEGKSAKLKMWHVIMLSSLLSMTFSYLALEYSLTGDVLAGFKSQQSLRNNERKLLYGNIDFVDKKSYDSSSDSLSQWAPSGKYYVDFDNHIAYPLKDDDLMGWRRYKTDLVILWYTTKSRMKDGWHKRINKINGGRIKLHLFLKNSFKSAQESLRVLHKEQKRRWKRLFVLLHNKYRQFSPHIKRYFDHSCQKAKQCWSGSRLQLRKLRFKSMKPFRVFQFKVRKDTNWFVKQLKRFGLKLQHSRMYKAMSECRKKNYFKCKH